MKQVLQDLRRGAPKVIDTPCPTLLPDTLLIRTTHSLISSGTERMLVDFGKANLIQKARQQPDKVRMALDKIRTDGFAPTFKAIQNKLDQPLASGYCNVGRVIEAGPRANAFSVGDRVVSNGRHAQIVRVPINLCAQAPAGVADEEAAFAVLAAVALQGVRLIQPTLGEAVAVIGLGLIGLLTVQLLRAHGCRVLGLDFDRSRLELARQFGAEAVDLAAGADPLRAAAIFSRGEGVDGVIIAASTKSNEPAHQAAQMCRKRGRIVLVGVAGLDLVRADFYEKELTLQVSCSYGPGRYDANYEEKGLDYPIGFVRWTEQRNFEAVLDLMADGRLDVKTLISHRFSIEEAERAYEVVGGAEPSLGVLLVYPDAETAPDSALRQPSVHLKTSPSGRTAGGKAGRPTIGVIGAGNYATGVLIPVFRAAGARLKTVASSSGLSAVCAARRFGFETAASDADAILADAAVDCVVIATRHDSHGRLAAEALSAGKHVFVEKPLALTHEEIDRIETARACALGGAPLLTVGFNRRFSPHAIRMKELLAAHAGPKAMIMTVNAGAVPPGHWTQDGEIGGGRIVGEACHFVDLLRFFAGAAISEAAMRRMGAETGDTVIIDLSFADGSIASIHYFANGSRAFPKERLEVFMSGRVLQLDNFRRLTGYGWKGFRTLRLWRQDKGQAACAAAFLDSVSKGGEEPIPFGEILEVSRTMIELTRGRRA